MAFRVLWLYQLYSGAPAAEGHHAESHTYRARAFLFVWSSSSAANDSRSRVGDEVAQGGAHTFQLMHCLHLCNLILWPIDSCQIKVTADQYHMTTSHLRLELIEAKCFFEVDRWPGYGFALDHRLKYFHKWLEQGKKTGAPFLGLGRSIYYFPVLKLNGAEWL